MKRTTLDRNWSRAVRERADFTCQRCGKQHAEKSQGLHGAHIFSRGIKRTRHEVLNGLALCYGCHQYIDSHREEKEALARKVLGDEVYEWLAEQARTPIKRQPISDVPRSAACAPPDPTPRPGRGASEVS